MPDPFDDNGASSGLVAKPMPGDNAAVLSITEISALLKRVVEENFGFVRLRGELSGVKRAASGHLYMRLKDEGAQIDAVMWRGSASRLGFHPEDGLEVVVTGKLTTYPGRSNYQIVVETMEIAGEGALLALLEKTRKRLEAEGLFASERKRALPFLPDVIGVVTSPTGAVIRDILHRLADRFPSRVLVWPVLVQGQGSAEQIAAAVRGFSAIGQAGPVPRPDVVIVARGGGSVEDLWSFNEEIVVRAIADSTIPVISAVGHETDTTLADFAADRRAPTPTAAAEIAVPVRAELSVSTNELALRQRRVILRSLAMGRERLEVRSQRLPKHEVLLQPQAQRLDEAADRLRRALADRAGAAREQFAALQASLSAPLLAARLRQAVRDLESVRLSPVLLLRRLVDWNGQLASLERLRLQLDPRAPLKRGYALVSGQDGKLVKTREQALQKALLKLEFADGSIEAVPHAKSDGKKPRKSTEVESGRQEKLL